MVPQISSATRKPRRLFFFVFDLVAKENADTVRVYEFTSVYDASNNERDVEFDCEVGATLLVDALRVVYIYLYEVERHEKCVG